MHGRRIVEDKLREMRARRGFTLVRLAEVSSVSLSLIKYAEVGERQLSDRTAWAVATALGCHPNDFSEPRADSKAAEQPGVAA